MDPDQLEGLTEAELRNRYEQAGRNNGTHEDFSDFVAEAVAKRRKTGESQSFDAGRASADGLLVGDAKGKGAGTKEKFKF